MLTVFFKGAVIAASLIVAIGAQNTFVLKQGLLRRHVFWVSFICFFSDVVLFGIGVFGIGGTLGRHAAAAAVLSLLGTLFLTAYGLFSLRRAFSTNHAALSAAAADGNGASGSLKQAVATTLAVTLLNPHVYLDSLILFGGLSAALHGNSEKAAFLFGALCVSALWFFGLGYGARLLQPVFARPRAWRIFDAATGLLMCWLAFGLWQQCLQYLRA